MWGVHNSVMGEAETSSETEARLRFRRLRGAYNHTGDSKVNSNADHTRDNENDKDDEDDDDIDESMMRSMDQ